MNYTVFTAFIFFFSTSIFSKPIANNDTISVKNTGSINLEFDILSNDRDEKGLSFWYKNITQKPSVGYGWVANRKYVYRLNQKHEGTVKVKYQIINQAGETSNEGIISIIIGSGNQDPVDPTPPTTVSKLKATDDQFERTYSGSRFSGEFNVLGNDLDPNNRAFWFLGIEEQPSEGYGYMAGGKYKYFSPSGFSGQITMKYKIANTVGETSIGTMTLSLKKEGTTPPQNSAPIARNDFFQVQTKELDTFLVLSNDTDKDGDRLKIAKLSRGAHGTAKIVDDQTISYQGFVTPSQKIVDVLFYTVVDGKGGRAEGKVTIEILPPQNLNIAPVAQNDTFQIKAKETKDFPVLTNDSDSNGDQVSLISVTRGKHGITSVVGNQIRYQGFTTPSQVISDIFFYTISDGKGGTDQGQVTVRISPPLSERPPATAQITLPVNVHFINYDESTKLSSNPREDSEKIIKGLNDNLILEGVKLVEFKIKEVKEHYSKKFFVLNEEIKAGTTRHYLDDFDDVAYEYTDQGVLNIIAVKSFAPKVGESGGVIGTAWYNQPIRGSGNSSTGVFTYSSAISGVNSKIVIHEIGHLFGLIHSTDKSQNIFDYDFYKRGPTQAIGNESKDFTVTYYEGGQAFRKTVNISLNQYTMHETSSQGLVKYFQRIDDGYDNQCGKTLSIDGKKFHVVDMVMRWHMTACTEPGKAFFTGDYTEPTSKMIKDWVQRSSAYKLN